MSPISLVGSRPALVLAAALVLCACDTVADGGVPRRAFLVAVQIDDAPLSDNGAGWDGSLGGGPDVYFRVYPFSADPAGVGGAECSGGDVLNPRDDDELVARGSDQPWVDDVDAADFPLVWDAAGRGAEFGDLGAEYRVTVCDYDPLDADDAIAQTEAFSFGAFAPDRADGAEDVIRLARRRGSYDTEVRLRVVYGD